MAVPAAGLRALLAQLVQQQCVRRLASKVQGARVNSSDQQLAWRANEFCVPLRAVAAHTPRWRTPPAQRKRSTARGRLQRRRWGWEAAARQHQLRLAASTRGNQGPCTLLEPPL